MTSSLILAEPQSSVGSVEQSYPPTAQLLAAIAGKLAAGKPVNGGTKMTKTRAREMIARFKEL